MHIFEKSCKHIELRTNNAGGYFVSVLGRGGEAKKSEALFRFSAC